ncbi:Ribonuclease H-like superfamily [Arabidopsis thaliana x Arabidopsis arenosa]|uniref:Ribonuclease H-like superfamily n=1 Tax=Arabidopsis thaliana x Arabidopsis arenosa TaxID=1240361 RepID=A0A8T1ZJJ2_9BRAS|nr:Ribonuclease H-like superfamily [Arabidopsis thaliana x Arabidopsis arenosa]
MISFQYERLRRLCNNRYQVTHSRDQCPFLSENRVELLIPERRYHVQAGVIDVVNRSELNSQSQIYERSFPEQISQPPPPRVVAPPFNPIELAANLESVQSFPIDKDPIEVLRLAEKEAQLWQSAQIELHNENHASMDLVNRTRVRDALHESNYSGYRCFVDGSWKESDKFSGTGWFCTSSNGEPPTMGAANLRRSLSPLHAEVEALLWAMKCMIGADHQEVAFFTDCLDLVKMVSSPTEWPAFLVVVKEFAKVKMNRPRKKREVSLMEELKELDLLGEGETVDIPDLENDDLIEENSMSVIVRCLNPTVHKVGGLVKALPPIWGMEDRVKGRGVGEDRVQFIFENEGDLYHVLIRIRGIPIHLVKKQAVESTIEPYGKVDAVELHAKNSPSLEYVRARTWIKADEPLQFLKTARFRTGEVARIELEYETDQGKGKEKAYGEEPDQILPSRPRKKSTPSHSESGQRVRNVKERLQWAGQEGRNKSSQVQQEWRPTGRLKEIITTEPKPKSSEDSLASQSKHRRSSDSGERVNKKARLGSGEKLLQTPSVFERLGNSSERLNNSEKRESNEKINHSPSVFLRFRVIPPPQWQQIVLTLLAEGGGEYPYSSTPEGNTWSVFPREPVGKSGGLALMWKESVKIKILQSDKRMIDALVSWQDKEFLLTCIYGEPVQSERGELWERLSRLGGNRIKPWMMTGDFNELVDPKEKIGGPVRKDASCVEFRQMLKACGLWEDSGKSSMSGTVPTSSGHIPSKDLLRSHSKGTANSMMEKLAGCRKEISQWKRRAKPSSALRIQELQFRIDATTRQIPFDSQALKDLRRELNQEYHHEEQFWKQKSRLTWVDEGDRNTKFFHAVTKNIRAQNRIQKLVDDDGKEWYTELQLGRVAEAYFKKLFTSEDVGYQIGEMDEVIPVVSPRMNDLLMEPVTMEEVKKATFDINPSKCPGPDGMTGYLYQQFWENMGAQITEMVQDFFCSGHIEREMNETNICLIPKKHKAERMLQLAEQKGQITGLRVARGAPPITYLLFADDRMFYCQEKNEELNHIIRIVEEYSLASGQRVNYQKSSITFGKNIPEARRTEIKNMMGINQKGGQGVYLGLPESFRGSKVSTLNYLRERLNTKISGWQTNFLSPGGKEVLLKAVAMALPTYTMACFKLPMTICQQIASIMADFWWKSKRESKGMHWKAWAQLSRPKDEGGLGFKDIEGFNIALLGKQLWRMISKKESLMARVYKSRYFSKSDPLNAPLGSRPSFAWKSIHEAQELLRQGTRAVIGNGASTDIWQHQWIQAKPAKAVQAVKKIPQSQYRFLSSLKYVKDLLDRSGREWKVDLLSDLFPENIKNQIIQIRPRGCKTSDRIAWDYTRDGHYSVKSGYWVLMEVVKQKSQPQVQ